MSHKDFEIKLLRPESYEEWNKFVDESPQGDVFCYSWWLDAVTHSRFKIYAVVEKERIVAGMPLAYDKFGKINEPYLTRTLGILYKLQETTSYYKWISNQRRWAEGLIEVIPFGDFVQTCTHHNFNDWLPYRWKGFCQTSRYTYLLDLNNRNPDDLKKGLKVNCKNAINKAERNNIRVEESQNAEELYNLVLQSYRRQGIKFRIPYVEFKALDEVIMQNGKRLIMIARDSSGNYHAGTYIAYNNRSAYFLLSGSNPDLRNLGGHTLAVWESMKFLTGKVTCFNFGGSDIKNIEDHFRGFGGVLTPYFHIFNERQLHCIDLRFHARSLFYHSIDILEAFRLRFFSY